MMAAVMLQAEPTFPSAHSQNSLLTSTVVNELLQLNNRKFPLYDAFHNRLRNYHLLEKE